MTLLAPAKSLTVASSGVCSLPFLNPLSLLTLLFQELFKDELRLTIFRRFLRRKYPSRNGLTPALMAPSAPTSIERSNWKRLAKRMHTWKQIRLDPLVFGYIFPSPLPTSYSFFLRGGHTLSFQIADSGGL